LLFAAGNLLLEGVAASFAGWRRPRTFMASKIKLPQAQEVPEKGLATPPDRPLLELSDAATKTLVRAAKKRGYITHDQINALSKEINSEQIEDILAMFSGMGINVVESEEASDDEETENAL
jgi:RNA polymerase primary sigma factor